MTRPSWITYSKVRKSRGRWFKRAVIVLSIIVLGGFVFFKSWKSFGGKISGQRLEKVQASPQYRDGKFVNSSHQPPFKAGEIWLYVKENLLGKQVRVPATSIPVATIQSATIQGPPLPGLRAAWLGHSTVYLEIDGLRLMTDPVFSERASPFGSMGPKRFHPPPITLTDLPKIDVVLISHDHPDHLDMDTVRYLFSKGTQFFVPLGVGAHFDRWGVPQGQVTELDWWESAEAGSVKIVCTPAQHYSGRRLVDYMATLWSSWSVIGPEHKVFYSGDTGFSDHFQKIGEELGPFDLSMIKIGLYGPGAGWIYAHIDPEEAIRAHLAIQARRMLPVHWGTFNIALHDWDEPIKRAVKAAEENSVDLVTPRVGEVVTAGEPFRSESWWEGAR
jgi:L-ascorbate metabolism protein UlaG (beta-lactamase superfamily)